MPLTLHESGSFTAEIKPSDGSVTWLSPRLGGGLVIEVADGSLVAVSRVNWTVTQMTPDARRMIGQRTLASGETSPPQWMALTADQKLIVAGTSASRTFFNSSDAQQKTLECYQTPGNPSCTSAVLSILSPELRDVLYSTYLPNSERLDGFRLSKDQLELFVKTSFLRQVTPGSVEGECPWYEKRILVPLNSLRETSSLKLPSQLRIAQSLLAEGSTRYFYSPADPIDAVFTGDTAQPEPDFCIYSSLDGEPARDWVSNTYYSIFFAKPRRGVKLTLDGESPRIVFQSPTQINFQVSARFFQGIFAVDGIPIDYILRGHRWGTILRAEPFNPARPALALITDESGRLLTSDNAAGTGDRVLIYTEGGRGVVVQSAPDEYPRVFPLGLIFERGMELPGYPNLYVTVARIPVGRPTDKPRRFYVGSPVGGGGPSSELVTWLRLQY